MYVAFASSKASPYLSMSLNMECLRALNLCSFNSRLTIASSSGEGIIAPLRQVYLDGVTRDGVSDPVVLL